MFFCCYISAIHRVFHMFLHDEKPYEQHCRQHLSELSLSTDYVGILKGSLPGRQYPHSHCQTLACELPV
jgi:hypothetical protein